MNLTWQRGRDEMDDMISRRAAVDAMCELMDHWFGADSKDEKREIKMELGKLPSVQPQRMLGKWIEKTVAENPKAAGIEEWQSCKCSNCGRYDTRPYMYYFDEPKYCSWCGADMRETE